jgi:hypothetical protein
VKTKGVDEETWTTMNNLDKLKNFLRQLNKTDDL